MKHVTASLLVLFVIGLMIPNAFAENIPEWVKNTAGWWATNQIDDSSFLQGIQYLIKEGIMVISHTETSESTGSQEVPGWIKNNAGWWAEGQIDDSSFVSGIQWLISNGIIVVEEKLIHTDVDFRVAFIGDQGLGPNAIAVLNLIKDEGAQIVLHQGDFDYLDDPDKWDRQISDVLGSDFPYFASIGHHEAEAWNDYQEKLYDRLKKIPDAVCYGDLGVKSNCTYKGLFFILVAPGGYTNDSDYDSFIEKQLNDNDYTWMICSWHNDVDAMQQEAKPNKTGWEVYESCKNGGAIIATAHQHVYTRSKTLIDFENQIVDPDWPGSNKLRVKEGATFTFISGLGGKSIFGVTSDHDWPINHSSDQGASYGALFCTFNVAGQPNKAYCYFKNIDGRIIDEFTITSFLGVHIDKINPTNVDLSGRDLTGNDLSNTTIIDTNLSSATLVGADLSNAVLIGTTLTGADLTDANLTGVSLKDKDLTGTILTGTNLTDVVLPSYYLSGKNFRGTIFDGVDLSGRDLSESKFESASFKNTNMKNADLTNAKFVNVDLTKVKSLVGANLFRTTISYSNLSGNDLDGVTLGYNNFQHSNLSGLDFTVASNKYIVAGLFVGADLSNANLEGFVFVAKDDLGNVITYPAVLTNGAKHADKSFRDLSVLFWEKGGYDMWVVTKKVVGNDLQMTIVRFTDFSSANLQNVNLSDADLTQAIFLNADLTNANLSNAILEGTSIYRANLHNVNFSDTDIRKAIFRNADLTNANLSNAVLTGADLTDANLTGAVLDGAILNCKNHVVCTPDT